MKIIFKTLLLLFIISISTCNVYTLLYSGKQTFLSFNNIEALASNEYTSNVYEFHQITIECGNTSFQAWRQWCCKGSKQKVCNQDDCTGIVYNGCSSYGREDV